MPVNNEARPATDTTLTTGELIIDEQNPHSVLPTHRLSGLPLPVLPIMPRSPDSQMWSDYDHSFYPRTSLQLQGMGGAAVRCSRGQDLPRWLHNRKHTVFPDGPYLPQTPMQKYVACVLACADYIPRQAIDLTPDGTYRITEMSDTQLDDLRRSRTLHIEDALHADGGRFYRNTIGKFFAYHATSQDISHVSSRVINEFLDTRDQARRKELGNYLLSESLDVALQPVRRLRQDLRDQGVVQLVRRDPHATVRKFFIRPRYADYYDELGMRLRQAAQKAA